MMQINRSQMLTIALVVFLLGAHFRVVESVVLNEQATKFLSERFKSEELASTGQNWFTQTMPVKKTLTPPKWIGWSLLSIGGVVLLHSIAMRK